MNDGPDSLQDGRQDGLNPATVRPVWRRWLPLALLLLVSLAVILLLWSRGVDFDTVARHRAWLVAQVADHRLVAGFAFFALYALTTALSLPIGSLLTVVGGFLFGPLTASLWVIAGATLGSVAIFLAARTALHDSLKRRAGPWLARMERGFRENALSYLLVLRLLPIFPFWLVNLVPALLGVPLRTFLLGTAFGIIPGTVVYAALGNGLGAVLEAGREPDLSLLFDVEVLGPLIGLSLLALLPVIYKELKRRRGAG